MKTKIKIKVSSKNKASSASIKQLHVELAKQISTVRATDGAR